MASKPCVICKKAAYPLESVNAGDDRFHKLCFRCPGKDGKCNVVLNVKTFTKKDGKVYCPNCGTARFDKNSQTADTMENKLVKEKPKIAPVNEQFRGENVGEKTHVGLDSLQIEKAKKAPKVGVVNEQVRGENAGEKTGFGMDSVQLDKAKNAPKVSVVNEQVRGEGAGQQKNSQTIF
eukprot:TRINITY_DN246_c0_g1_i1.p1 TRINITY_DN246_c0_g1~~TRINITY_DN246_c0_g1_i1.p1  ORF type:complete len:178 (+),score=46.19 TRINITY_DN246_c0_g1_i1:64-597(+)